MTIAVSTVTGIGPKTAAYLRQQGITTVEQLLAGGVALLSGAPGFGEARARAVIEAAGTLHGSNTPKPVKADKADKKKKHKKSKEKKGKKGKKGSKDGEKVKGKKKKKDKDKKKKKK